jgi:hypothetical protein
MATDLHGNKQSPETLRRSVDSAVKEWRQIAIAEGIAPTKVDRYLLDRDDVPEDVKEFIRKVLDAEGISGAEVPGGAVRETPVSQDFAPATAGVGSIPAPAKPKESSGEELAGEVGMLNAKSEIQQIKEDIIQKSEQEMATETQVEQGEKPSVEPESQQIAKKQTAEGKEQTTTMGTQDTAGGVATRMSLGMSGYAPSQQVASNAKDIAEKGPVNDSKTWQAMVLQRFLEIWGSFKGLFAEQN